MATDAVPLDSLLLPPLVLKPPLGPRILRAMALALACIFHLLTAGWSLIANGTEGQIAGAAKAMLRNQQWLHYATSGEPLPGPLTVWLVKASMNAFGINEFAARLPNAAAVVAAVWFTMRLGERFGGTWRGFAAGMILICSPGMFTVARELTPAPVVAACVSGTFYFLARGFQRRTGRRQWFCLAWIAMGLCYFAGGWRAAALPVGATLFLAVFYREARIRFPALISLEGALVLASCILGAGALSFWNRAESGGDASGAALCLPSWGPGRLLLWQIALLFPWSILLVQAAYNVALRLCAHSGVQWSEAFPLAWLATGLLLAMSHRAGGVAETVAVWPAFALWAALRLETMPRLRFLYALACILLAAVGGLFFTGRLASLLMRARPEMASALRGIPAFFWPSAASVAVIAGIAFVLLAASAFWFEVNHRRRFALLALFGAMIPAGYAFADTAAKFAPFVSYADFARCIYGSLDSSPQVVVDETRMGASSLRFYLEDPCRSDGRLYRILQNGSPPHSGDHAEKITAADLTQLWTGPDAAFLITRRAKLSEFRQMLGGNARVACESGENILLTNRAEPSAP